MRKTIRLALACALVSGAACAAEPTGPTSMPLSPTLTARHDFDPNMLPDGTCRGGYQVANGRCVAI